MTLSTTCCHGIALNARWDHRTLTVKRTSTKIASSTVAAATIGTAAVAITVAGLEVYSYCEDKNELHEDEKNLFKTKTEFDFKQCLIDAKKDSNEIIVAVKKAVPEIVGSAWESFKDRVK
jgi:hypothetical protein